MPGLISDRWARVTSSCLLQCMPLPNIRFADKCKLFHLRNTHKVNAGHIKKGGGGWRESTASECERVILQELISYTLRRRSVLPQLRKHRQLKIRISLGR